MIYNDKNEPCALVFNIQRYTIHDGPGIRTEIFLKGCPLHCLWCSNPESISTAPQLGIYPSKCLGADKCGYCLKACPEEESPLKFDESGIILDAAETAKCASCGRCASMCPAKAIIVWGKKMNLDELMKVIESDRSFYQRSGGGVTLSGGEVMLQWEFVVMLLKRCREAGIHTCVESALLCPSEHLDEVLKYTDLFITDIKHMNTEKHREISGAGNEVILQNIKRVSESGVPLVIRTPIVPGYNADDQSIAAIGRFIKSELGNRILQYQLLPYRKMGTEKYDSLRKAYPLGDFEQPKREEWEPNLLHLVDMLQAEYGVPAVAGSAGKLPGY